MAGERAHSVGRRLDSPFFHDLHTKLYLMFLVCSVLTRTVGLFSKVENSRRIELETRRFLLPEKKGGTLFEQVQTRRSSVHSQARRYRWLPGEVRASLYFNGNIEKTILAC